MQIQIPIDEELVVKSLATSAGFTSIDQYVLDLIERDKERVAIQVGLDQARRGEVRSLELFDSDFRQRKGILAEN